MVNLAFRRKGFRNTSSPYFFLMRRFIQSNDIQILHSVQINQLMILWHGKIFSSDGGCGVLQKSRLLVCPSNLSINIQIENLLPKWRLWRKKEKKNKIYNKYITFSNVVFFRYNLTSDKYKFDLLMNDDDILGAHTVQYSHKMPQGDIWLSTDL